MDQIFERVTAALATLRVGAADSEEQLHRQAAEAFANAGLEAAHEVSLAPRCRIDFMVGDIGVEIKKKRPQRAPLVAQLTRYANCPQIARLIVLAPRGVDLPKSIGGKPSGSRSGAAGRSSAPRRVDSAPNEAGGAD